MTTPNLAHHIVELLSARGLTVSFGESLTGGLLVDQLVSVPGASQVVQGSLVTYATAAKMRLLNVPGALIAQHTVVSAQVATAMAAGALAAFESDIAISATGVAGPDPQEGKRVGEVYVGFAQRDGLDLFDPQEVLALDLGVLVTSNQQATRAQIRKATVKAALGVLAGRLEPPQPFLA